MHIGVLAHRAEHQNVLRALIKEAGYDVSLSISPSELESLDENLEIAAWLVELDFSQEQETEHIEDWLDTLAVPVIVDHELCEAKMSGTDQEWRRRIKEKITHLPGMINLHVADHQLPEEVWVLAASTGGPEAIAQFFSNLPEKLDIAFIYVQHINVGHEESLCNIIERNSSYKASVVADGDLLSVNHVSVMPTENRVQFLDNGSLHLTGDSWLGPYKPSVDQVVSNIARLHKQIAGVIVFSGMGDDGAAACKLMNQQKGQVWVQSPESCTVDSMPVSVQASAEFDYVGTPVELARRLGYWRRQ